jgi:hypothetical protein
MLRRVLGNLELGVTTLAVVAVLVGIRAVLWVLGVEGMPPTALSAGIITGGVFVMGLVVAGTLSDYRDAERAPTDLAAGLYSILREGESMHAVWGAPDMPALRRRLIAVVTTLRADIASGDTRTCQAAIEDLSETFSSSTNRTSRRTTSSASAPSRPGCASRCCASTTCSTRSSSPRPTR